MFQPPVEPDANEELSKLDREIIESDKRLAVLEKELLDLKNVCKKKKYITHTSMQFFF